MTAPPDAVANLYKLVSELEQRLESSFAAHDAAIARQVATDRENARLIGELAIARERQDASADILSTIANASGDAAASLQRIAETTARLFDAASVSIRIADGSEWGLSIRVGVGEERIAAAVPMEKVRIGGRNLPGTVVAENRQIHIPDLDNVDPDIADWPGLPPARAAGTRVLAGTPLRREGQAIGVLIVHRDRPEPFTAEELALQQSFADQAAIALENARLFNETRQALERQNASAAILRTIASAPGDAERALHQIAETSARLFGAPSATIHIAEGDGWAKTIRFGDSSKRVGAGVPDAQLKIGGRNMPGTIVGDNRQVNIPDVDNVDPAISDWPGLPYVRAAGTRSTSGSPLRREGKAIGALIVYRDRLAPFTDEEMALQQSFADQAAIAIENARLFNETREALERQTATSDILKVIASSPSDVQPVFEAIVDSSKRLLGGFSAAVFRFIDGIAYLEAITPTNPAADEVMKNSFPRPVTDFQTFAIVQGGKIVQVSDTEALSDDIRDIARGRGFRSMLLAPLMSSGTPIGLVSVTRVQAGTFAAHHEQLLQTFADQAAIAIENVRLFNEVRQRTEDLSESLQQQTAVGDVLKTISRSTFDLQPVLDTLVNTAALLCDAEMAFIMRREGDQYRAGAAVGYSSEYIEFLRNNPLSVDRGSITGRAVLERRTVQILDVATDPEYTLRESTTLARQHTTICVPLLRENEPIGTIVLARQRVEPFTQNQIDLVTTFADQAVIAIENVRLFNETREALEQQQASANILRAVSNSVADTQPVFEEILNSIEHLFEAEERVIFLAGADGMQHIGAIHGPASEKVRAQFPAPLEGTASEIALRERRLISSADVFNDPEIPAPARERARQFGNNYAMAVAPMLWEDRAVGSILVARASMVPFSEKECNLLRSFADQAVIAIQNARLFEEVQARTNDLSKSLQQQTATADVLKVISRSAFDLQTVLDTLVKSAARLCEADMAAITRQKGDEYFRAGSYGFTPEFMDYVKDIPVRPERTTITGRTLLEGRVIHVPDVHTDPDYSFTEAQRLSGDPHTFLGVPLLREGNPVGALVLLRKAARPFTDKQIGLVTTFADQAVIAIENVRLFDEVQAKTRDLTEALTYQTGSGKILSVIASSPTEVGPVLNAIVESACGLCEAYDAVVLLKDGDHLRFSAHHGPIGIYIERWPISRNWTAGRAFLDRKPVHVQDMLSDEGAEFPDSRELSRHTGTAGIHSILAVPLLSENESIGTILLRRTEVHPFSDKQIALLQTFADQAVIAIGNVRLFEEVQAKTRDLTEALTYQTGSANILSVIASSPTDVKPVLTAIVESACELCEAPDAVVLLKDGDDLRHGAHHGPISSVLEKWPISRNWVAGRAMLERKAVQVHDIMAAEGDEFPETRDLARRTGNRSFLCVPLLREGESIGVITLRRTEVQPFSDKQIALLQTFADQAVIAIGNVRLFEEVQAKTRDLSEALTYQTGSGNILRVIASSPTDVKPVLTAIVESACELCEANDALASLRDGDELVFQAQHGSIPVVWDRQPVDRQAVAGLAVIDRTPVHVHDLLAPEGEQFPRAREFARTTNVRTVLCVPLLRDGESIGVIVLRRTEVRPFSDKQIALLQTFADQAVIAIGNVRLFEEVQARTRELSESLEQQTATSEVLSVISRSAGDLEPVFQSMLENATRICGAQFGLMNLYEEGSFHTVGFHNVPPAFAAARQQSFRPHPDSDLSKMVRTKKLVQIDDLRTRSVYLQGDPATVQLADLAGARTVLIVPMVKDDEFVGSIGIYRLEVSPFNEKQIALLNSFASQAVIAIENTRLLKELRERTDDLTKSLDNLRTAQDRLVQTEKLASLGQLTAGIAHEIKNPLNFVNNFAALSAELTDELNDVLKQAEIAETIRGEVDELTGLLKDNLQKVVQHGKRADSIVKNMLLHSREGSGDHRPTDINALVDESLNLAYHGARAEKPNFNVTLRRDLDASAGTVEVFPQEITRVFLNLVSNGFYAVAKRKAEAGEAGFDPVLSAATRDLGDAVEIRIRDNGTGIPQDVRDKMFNPFFTTKPAGEGTGLGLSMSHDIIVKQHGGTIDVITEPGHFTEFRIVLPRTGNSANKPRG